MSVELIEIRITGDSKKAQAALKETNKELSGLGNVAKGVSASVLGAGVAIGGLALAGRQIYDFAKQGAALKLTEGRFYNVAEAAGYSADILLREMAKASGGLQKDSVLMASGLNIIELGLVDTMEGVVELSTAVSVLGLDMQQVILTFANNSVARLDTLGLSVQSVTDRAEELNRQGFDGDAFDQAVLEGLTNRMEVLGDVAETDIGSFQRLEAALGDLGDAFLKKLAPPIARAADTLALLLNWNDAVNGMFEEAVVRITQTAGSYDEYIDRMIEANAAADQLNEQQVEALYTWVELGEETGELAEKTGILTEEAWRWTRVNMIMAEQMERNSQASEELGEDMEGLATETSNAAEAAKLAEDAYKDMFDAADQNWAGIFDDFAEGVEFIAGGGLAFQDFEAHIDKAGLKFSQLSDNVKKSVAPELEKIGKTGSQAAIMMEQAFGRLSIKDAADQFIELGLSSQEAWALAQQSGEGWQGVLSSADRLLLQLIAQMGLLDGMSAELFVNIRTQGSFPALPGVIKPGQTSLNVDEFKAAGGPVSALRPYIVGEEGPELFVPETNGTIIPNDFVSGPAGGSMLSGAAPTIVINYAPEFSFATPEEVEERFYPLVDRAIRESNRYR